MQEGFYGDENNQLRLVELEALDEKWLQAWQKLVLPGSLGPSIQQEGSLGDEVLALRRPIITTHKTGGIIHFQMGGTLCCP